MKGKCFGKNKVDPSNFMQFSSINHLNKLDQLNPQDVQQVTSSYQWTLNLLARSKAPIKTKDRQFILGPLVMVVNVYDPRAAICPSESKTVNFARGRVSFFLCRYVREFLIHKGQVCHEQTYHIQITSKGRKYGHVFHPISSREVDFNLVKKLRKIQLFSIFGLWFCF